jgi:hypothetical protein
MKESFLGEIGVFVPLVGDSGNIKRPLIPDVLAGKVPL